MGTPSSRARYGARGSELGARATIWDLLQTFFKARALFMEIYEAYEARVLRHAKEGGVAREDLRLDAKGVSALLDLKKVGELRERYLLSLKEIAHDLFRSEEATDIFDRYVHDVFHEISILKEEHLKVFTFAPEYGHLKGEEDEEYQVVLDEVHQLFPHKVHHVHALFGKAKTRLEQILPGYGEDRVLMRSIYLFGEELLGDAYDGGLEGFYKYLYPDLGAVEGYFQVGKSFLESRFLDKAKEALLKCIALGEKTEPKTPALEKMIADARDHLEAK